MHVNRSASRFLLVSGTYLFLILLLNSTQPVVGHSAGIYLILLRNLLFLPVWIGIAIIAIICRKIRERNSGKELMSAPVLFWVIITSVVAGFFFNIDYQRLIGCFYEEEPDLSPVKFIVNGISMVLLSLGYLFSGRKIGVYLLVIELLFWTLKTLLYYNASLDLVLSGYFSVSCWVLRTAFIMKFIKPTQDIKLKIS